MQQIFRHLLICGCLVVFILALYGWYNESKTVPFVSEGSPFHDDEDNQREKNIACNQAELAIDNYTLDVNKFPNTSKKIHQRGHLNVTSSTEMAKRKRIMTRGCLLEGFLMSRRHWNYRYFFVRKTKHSRWYNILFNN